MPLTSVTPCAILMRWAMDDDFMPTVVAMRYLGIDDYDELEELVVEHGVEADFDHDGVVIAVQNGPALREALFESHKRKVGYRPDDLRATEHIRAAARAEAEAKKVFRRSMRPGLERRVARKKLMREQGGA